MWIGIELREWGKHCNLGIAWYLIDSKQIFLLCFLHLISFNLTFAFITGKCYHHKQSLSSLKWGPASWTSQGPFMLPFVSCCGYCKKRDSDKISIKHLNRNTLPSNLVHLCPCKWGLARGSKFNKKSTNTHDKIS